MLINDDRHFIVLPTNYISSSVTLLHGEYKARGRKSTRDTRAHKALEEREYAMYEACEAQKALDAWDTGLRRGQST